MTLIADFLADNVNIDKTAPIQGIDAVATRYLERRQAEGDFEVRSGYGAQDEVQSLAVYEGTVSGGDFTLEFTLRNGETFTTAAIAFDANAATIEAAIDTAATGVVTGWTNGDITVTGGDLNSAPVVFTFDGDSVTGNNHDLIIVDGSGLTGGGSAGEVTVTTEGQTVRAAWQLLYEFGVVTSAPPAQGEDASALTVGDPAASAAWPPAALISLLADAAAIEDLNLQVATEIKAAVPGVTSA